MKNKKKAKKKFQFKVEYWNGDAELLICTPLRSKEEINPLCKKTVIAQEDTKFIWTSFASNGNASYNRMQCYNRSINSLFPKVKFKYVIFIDRDILWVYPMAFKEMIAALENSSSTTAFSYCSFKYIGDVQHSFFADVYDVGRLLRYGNYISTMSMIKIDAFEKIHGFDVSLKRFQDWDLWIRFGLAYFEGIPVNPGIQFFHAVTHLANSISGKPSTAKDQQFLARHHEKFIGLFPRIS